jgi:serine/threonine protein kinase
MSLLKVVHMMELDPSKRITAAEALQHRFFALPSRSHHHNNASVDRNRNVEEKWKEEIIQVEYGNDCAIREEDISRRRTPKSNRTMLGNISRAAPAASIISPPNIRHINIPNTVPSKQYRRPHTDKDDHSVKDCFHRQGTNSSATSNFTRVGCDSVGGTIGNKRKHEQLHTSCANLGADVATNAASSTLFESNKPCVSDNSGNTSFATGRCDSSPRCGRTHCSRTTETFPSRHRYPMVSHLQRLEMRQAVLCPRPDYMDMQPDLVWYSLVWRGVNCRCVACRSVVWLGMAWRGVDGMVCEFSYRWKSL